MCVCGTGAARAGNALTWDGRHTQPRTVRLYTPDPVKATYANSCEHSVSATGVGGPFVPGRLISAMCGAFAGIFGLSILYAYVILCCPLRLLM